MFAFNFFKKLLAVQTTEDNQMFLVNRIDQNELNSVKSFMSTSFEF
jgi:hypothetical protein